MDGRHRFILQRLKDGFNIARVTVIEQFLSQEKVLSQINDFFRGDGIPTLIFLYQPARSGLEDDGERPLDIIRSRPTCLSGHSSDNSLLLRVQSPSLTLAILTLGIGNADATPVLTLNTASKDKMMNKAIYFVRSNAKGVTQAIEQDVCYGEIPKDPLADFDFILDQVDFLASFPGP